MNTTAEYLFGGALFCAGLATGDDRESSHPRTHRTFAAAFVATTSLVTAPTLMADIINVPDDFPTIQGAIDASADGDEIIVAPGEYVESIDFLGKDIMLHSSEGQEVTTIDGGGETVVVGAFVGARLEGFTITGGGTGMYNSGYAASPTVIDCTFTGNAYGMFVFGPTFPPYANPTVIGCTFIANSAVGIGTDYNAYPTIIGCTFSGNGSYGVQSDTFPLVINCTFEKNVDGGVYGEMLAINCVLADNYGPGAMSPDFAYFINCALTGNGGDGVSAADANDDVWLYNCTIVGNSGHGVTGGSGTVREVANCILWGNSLGSFGGDAPDSVTYSDIEGGWPGEGNIAADPLFVAPKSGDYRLSRTSPCIDAGHNASVPDDEFDLDEDGDTDEPLPYDLDGNPRFVDDPRTKDTGNGTPPIVDMGAYEFQVVSCVWDLDGDNNVGTGDLILLLGAWGDPYGTADLIELLGNWGPCR